MIPSTQQHNWSKEWLKFDAVAATEHIRRVLAEHSINARGVREVTGSAWRTQRLVAIPSTITSQKRYAVALHEIGHILGPRQDGTALEEEMGAWEWALENSVVPFTPSTFAFILHSLGTYVAATVRSGGSSAHRTYFLLPPTHEFWRWLEEIAPLTEGGVSIGSESKAWGIPWAKRTCWAFKTDPFRLQ